MTPNFLANGGLQPTTGLTTYTTAAAAQAATANYKQDQYLMPYALNWNIGVATRVSQRLHARSALSRHQGRPSSRAEPAKRRPGCHASFEYTYIPVNAQRPDTSCSTAHDGRYLQHQLVLPPWRANFSNLPITSYLFRGNSIYHGLATEFSRRFSKGLFFKTAYTWSHALDDSTADVKSTLSRRAARRTLPT